MDQQRGVAGGDAHKNSITMAVLDCTGREVAVDVFSITAAGLFSLVEWLRSTGLVLERVGIEGSASWGLPASKALAAAGFDVREVNPARTSDRRRRRRRPKTDREDALAIAREVLADDALPPAGASQAVAASHEAISLVTERRRSLIRRRQRLLNEAEMALAKLPVDLREKLGAGTVAARLNRLSRLDAQGGLVDWLLEMRSDLLDWDTRIAELEAQLPELLSACGSTLTTEVGLGVVSAAELVAEVGDPHRFRSESAFARWAGAAPVATSSGEGDDEPVRHRLDLLGNRTVNRILYVMSITQARHDPAGKAFLARKRAEGKTGKEARRAHKRQLANRVIRRMWADQNRLRDRLQQEQLAVA